MLQGDNPQLKCTFLFNAELKRNEILIDLAGNEKNLHILLNSPSMEIRFGRDGSGRILLFLNDELARGEKTCSLRIMRELRRII